MLLSSLVNFVCFVEGIETIFRRLWEPVGLQG